MRLGSGGSPADLWWAVAALALLAAAVAAAIAGLVDGESLANDRDDLAMLLFAAAGVVGLVAWRSSVAASRSARAAAESLRSALQEREGELARTREETAAKLAERDREMEEERELRSRIENARDLEREWNRELRAKLAEFSEERGVLGSPRGVAELLLRVALTLVGGEKGLLLRSGGDSERALTIAAGVGFEHPHDDSGIARHFAGQVLARDETVRINDPEELDLHERTPADEEITNLVAIPIYVRDRFSGVVVCANKEGGFDEYDDDVLLALGDHAGALLENGRLQDELRSAYLATVALLAQAIEVKDPFVHGHSEDVSRYVQAVAEGVGLEPKRREELVFASLLHDVGKLGISERVLLKPAALTPEERSVIEMHPRIGYRLLQLVPALREIAPAVLHHHEHFDGNGYPTGLRGEQIPLEARIIAVVDAFSAMTTDRPYRKARSVEEACAELERCAGTQFDPRVVRLFVEEVRETAPDEAKEPALDEALADPEIEARRSGDEPLLGFGSFAVTDNLTLLYSHRHFFEAVIAEAERAAVQGSPFAVVLARVADIVQLNRMQGFAAGDEAIRDTARAVQLVAARVNGTACRFSGSSIGLVAQAVDERAAERLAEEVLQAVTHGAKVQIGVATWRVGESGEDVIARARADLRARTLVA